MAEYPEQNNTNFPQALRHNLGKLPHSPRFLKYYQFITSEYVAQNRAVRGLLIYFSVGFGKTILAIELARHYKTEDPSRKIIVLLSKGLIQNFKDNAKKYLHDELGDTSNLEDMFKFISFRSNTMYKKLADDRSAEQEEFDEQIGNIAKSLAPGSGNPDFLENSVLIVDEAHNFFNAITNGSKNSLQLYEAIMRTKNIKVFFLTGTPIINDPFELVPCFNMIKGSLDISEPSRCDRHDRRGVADENLDGDRRGGVGRPRRQFVPLFPESRKEFYHYFVDTLSLDVKNKSRFQNRIMGLSSYYGDMYFEQKSSDFPEQKPTVVERVPMSPEQFASYDVARDFEREEATYKKKVEVSERFGSASAKSTYRVKSRQISNFVFPEYALGPQRGKKMREKFIERITPEDWHRLDVFSPKIKKMLENIQKHPEQLGLVYSEFVAGEGISVVAKVLEANGYTQYTGEFKQSRRITKPANAKKSRSTKRRDISISVDPQFGGHIATEPAQIPEPDQVPESPSEPLNMRYAIITGQVDLEIRTQIIEEFNSIDNLHGEKIALLLVNKIAAEGLHLEGIRHIHILEPFWNQARIEQIIGRGVRYKSHEKFPVAERNVQPYIYLSDYPTDYPKERIKELTTDIDIYQNALQNDAINSKFKLSIVESSIDCLVHRETLPETIKKQINCKLCLPTNKPLYHPIIAKDFSVPDPCQPPNEQKIQATEILLSGVGEKFAYVVKSASPPEIDIYRYDPNIDGYVPISMNHPYREIIVNKILDAGGIAPD